MDTCVAIANIGSTKDGVELLIHSNLFDSIVSMYKKSTGDAKIASLKVFVCFMNDILDESIVELLLSKIQIKHVSSEVSYDYSK